MKVLDDRAGMPYILKIRRDDLLRIPLPVPQNAGELNFLITELVLQYLTMIKVPRYTDYNAIIGVLDCAKQEFYRRMIAPYEDSKIEENGDVY